MLLQISEPSVARAKPRRFAVGIDLGTTNSLVAAVTAGGERRIFADAQGERLLPSVAHYAADGTTTVGRAAAARRNEDSANTIFSVKRLMGRGKSEVADDYYYHYAESDGMAKLRTAAGDKSPVEVSADILRALARRAAAANGGAAVEGAVITVPAYFDEAQRQATKDAARLAGLPLLRLLNEPTAAAVAHGLDNAEEGVYVVYDLGGGTFDLSALRLRRGVFQTLAIGGDSALGGDDYDRALARTMAARLNLGAWGDLSDADKTRLIAAARQCKESLAATERAEFCVELGGGKHVGEATAAEFEEATKHLTQKTIDLCAAVLRDAGVDKKR